MTRWKYSTGLCICPTWPPIVGLIRVFSSFTPAVTSGHRLDSWKRGIDDIRFVPTACGSVGPAPGESSQAPRNGTVPRSPLAPTFGRSHSFQARSLLCVRMVTATLSQPSFSATAVQPLWPNDWKANSFPLQGVVPFVPFCGDSALDDHEETSSSFAQPPLFKSAPILRTPVKSR